MQPCTGSSSNDFEVQVMPFDDCDLYAEDFDPRLSRAERLAYHDERSKSKSSAPHVARLLAADALVLCSRCGITAFLRS